MSELMLHIKLLNEAAYKPERSTEQATGYDLRCTEDFSVPAFAAVLVPLGFAMQVVNNSALIDAQIRPRSSVSLKGINTPIGTIDLDYRGEVKVCLQNITPKVIDFNKGDKIAQMVFLTYDTPIVQLKTELTTTERGEGGFGSTGR
jgi:dUTP pyrophosphatase